MISKGGVIYLQQEGFIIQKIFNNNVVLANHSGREKILIKKGIGFGKKQGDLLCLETKFDKVFTFDGSEIRENFKQLVTRVDDELIGICEEIICMIAAEIKNPLDENIHIRLIDHIAFTLYRIKQNDKITNPFMIEIETLYPEEMRIAEKSAKMLEKSTGVLIPDDEIGFIALHIHSARNRGKLSNTIKYAYIANSAVDLIGDELGVEISRRSIDYVRFVSHIRFAIERIIKDIPLKNDLLGSIKRTYKSSYKVAKKVSKLIENEIYKKIPEEEVGLITLHIERLKNAASNIDLL